jgi:hypothetical protein
MMPAVQLLADGRKGERVYDCHDQFYDSRHHAWANDLLERLGLPTQIMPQVISPATVIGLACRSGRSRRLERDAGRRAGLP